MDGTPFERWRVGASTYETCLTRGARLMRWNVGLPGAVREVLHWPQDAPTDLAKIGAVRGGNPVLFPFMGRNYAEHAREMGHDPDREPPFFFTSWADSSVTLLRTPLAMMKGPALLLPAKLERMP